MKKTLRAGDVICRVSGRSQNSKAPFVSRHMFNWGAFCRAHRKRSMRRAHSGAQTDVWALGASLSLSLSCTKLWVCSRNCTAFPCIGKTLQGPWIERGPLNSRRLNCAGSIDFPGKKQQVHQDQPGLRCLMLLPLGIYLSVCVMLRFWPTPSLVPDSKAHTWPSTVQLFFYSKDLIFLVSVLSCRFLHLNSTVPGVAVFQTNIYSRVNLVMPTAQQTKVLYTNRCWWRCPDRFQK